MSDKDEEPLDETHPMDLLAEKGTIPFSSIMEYDEDFGNGHKTDGIDRRVQQCAGRRKNHG